MFYELQNEYRGNKIGNVETVQSDELVGLGNKVAYSSLKSFFKSEPYQKPKVSPFLLKKKAKLTDCISSIHISIYSSFILKNNLSELIKGYNIREFYEIPVELTYDKDCKKIISGYSLFLIKDSIFSFVDFSESSFYFNSILEKYYEKVEVDSVESLKKHHEKRKKWHHMLNFKKIKLKPECEFDMFRIGHKMGGYYVSERLKDAIEKKGFTGLIFEEADNIVIER